MCVCVCVGGGVITKSDFFLGGGGHFYTFWGVLRSRYRMGIIFWGTNFQIFLGIPDIPDFFSGGGGGGGGGGGLGLNSRKLRVPSGVSFGTDLYFYSSLVWRARH